MVRHEAVEALGNIPGADTEALLRRVQADDEGREVRDSAQLALANLAYLRDRATL
jgi:HEAT repeat protein